MKELNTDKIILFDGVCNLCNTSIQFILKNEKTSILKFAPLQSEFGRKILLKNKMDTSIFNSIIFIENDVLHYKSKAIFSIAEYLKRPYSFAIFFKFLPLKVTDFFYDVIAKNRYKWLGRTRHCMIPNKEIEKRFIK